MYVVIFRGVHHVLHTSHCNFDRNPVGPRITKNFIAISTTIFSPCEYFVVITGLGVYSEREDSPGDTRTATTEIQDAGGTVGIVQSFSYEILGRLEPISVSSGASGK